MTFAVMWLAVITAVNMVGLNAGKWLNNIGSTGMWLSMAGAGGAGGGGGGAVRGGNAVFVGSDDAAFDGEERNFLGDDFRRVFGLRDGIVYGGGDRGAAEDDSAGAAGERRGDWRPATWWERRLCW